MDGEPRKATEILSDLEGKIDYLIAYTKTQDHSIKILSNKLNEILSKNNTYVPIQPPPQFKIESVDTSGQLQKIKEIDSDKQIPISSEFNLPIENSPKGFRRTSRPETYAGDDQFLEKPQTKQNKITPKSEVIVPQNFIDKKNEPVPPIQKSELMQNAVPVSQRVVDKNGKSVFLADVEIIDLSTNTNICKTRTSGTGKWVAALGVGNYKILIRKRESLTKQSIESIQEINVDGATSPYELKNATMI